MGKRIHSFGGNACTIISLLHQHISPFFQAAEGSILQFLKKNRGSRSLIAGGNDSLRVRSYLYFDLILPGCESSSVSLPNTDRIHIHLDLTRRLRAHQTIPIPLSCLISPVTWRERHLIDSTLSLDFGRNHCNNPFVIDFLFFVGMRV